MRIGRLRQLFADFERPAGAHQVSVPMSVLPFDRPLHVSPARSRAARPSKHNDFVSDKKIIQTKQHVPQLI